MPTVVLGNPTGETIVFLSGFPDNHSVWTSTMVPKFEKTHRCVVVCFPGYDSAERRIGRFGLSFPQILAAFDATVRLHVPATQQFHLMAHDWGSFVAHCWTERNAERVKRLALLDVLVSRSNTLLENGTESVARLLAYQGKME